MRGNGDNTHRCRWLWAFPHPCEFTEQLRAFATSTLLPGAADRVLSVYLSEFAANAAQVSVIGLTVLVVTAMVGIPTVRASAAALQPGDQRGRAGAGD